MQTINSLPNYHLRTPSQSRPNGSRYHQRRVSIPVSPRGTPQSFQSFPSPASISLPSPSFDSPGEQKAWRRTSHPSERLLATGFSAHEAPVDSDDDFLTTDISSKLLWRQLDEYFFHESMDKVEEAGHDWVRGFGKGLLCVMGVRLKDKTALLRKERSIRQDLALSAATSHPHPAPAALRPIFSASEANLTAFSANSDPTGIMDTNSPAITDMEIDDPNAAPGEDSGDDELFTESDFDLQKRAEKAEREIEIATQMHEAAWRWIGAHLDHYALIWKDKYREKGVGVIGLWKELVELRREMDALEEDVMDLTTRSMSLSH